MEKKIDISVNPEFSYEIALVIPYAHWLHERGQLGTVSTVVGMKPFYFFTDNFVEKFDFRTVNNSYANMSSIPNDWIHHNAIGAIGRDYSTLTPEEKESVNGVLDYTQWSPPNYKAYYANDEYRFGDKFIVIANRYNYEHNKPPRGYFNLECLQYLFTELTAAGYHVIYKRPENTEFAIDENEQVMLDNKLVLKGLVPGIGVLTDKELAIRTPNVHLLETIPDNGYSYNEKQLRIFANASGFISMAGGNGILSSYFGVPNITYVTTSGELRDGYFGPNSYYRKLSGAEIYAIRNPETDIDKYGHNYRELFATVKRVFL